MTNYTGMPVLNDLVNLTPEMLASNYIWHTAGTFIGVAHSASGANLYAILRSQMGYVYVPATYPARGDYEAYATANLANYAIPLTEEGTASRWYKFELPIDDRLLYAKPATGLPGEDLFTGFQWIYVDIYVRAGASPAEGDSHVTGMVVGVEQCRVNDLPSARVYTHRPFCPAQDQAFLFHAVPNSISANAIPVSKKLLVALTRIDLLLSKMTSFPKVLTATFRRLGEK